MTIVRYIKCFFLVISLSQLVCYICTHVYICTNRFPCSIVLDMSCLCYVYNTTVMCYICNKGVMDVTSLFCYICNSHSFLQMFAQDCYLCKKRQHPECQRKELWQVVSKFVCDMTNCIHTWLTFIFATFLVQLFCYTCSRSQCLECQPETIVPKKVSNSWYIRGVIMYIMNTLRM